jgi:8-hydroxy-5-deazaflavin:NADPH oxidoreductase
MPIGVTQGKDLIMHLTIIGTGKMARGIGTRALAGGHTVTVLGREAGKAQELAGELGSGATPGMVGDALGAEVAVLAVPYTALDDVLGRYGQQLKGRIVVDITNPVDFATFRPIVPEAGSGAEQIAAAVPGARVVKAFNTTFAGTLLAGQVAGQPLDVFLAADDAEAKGTVARIVEDGGLRAVDAGGLSGARQLEALGYLHMSVQQTLDTGFASAVKVLAA